MLETQNVGNCRNQLFWKSFFNFLVADFFVFDSEFEDLVKKLVHVEIVDVFVDELNDWKTTFMQVAYYI